MTAGTKESGLFVATRVMPPLLLGASIADVLSFARQKFTLTAVMYLCMAGVFSCFGLWYTFSDGHYEHFVGS